MSKVFTSEEFIKKLKWLVNDVPNVYHSEKGTWCTLHKGKVWLDCVVSIKGLLWNFRNDYSINNRGGAVYGANGVKDFTANGGINYCDDASTNFKNIVPGEYLCMKGTPYEHAGVYLGDGKVFECTTGWNVNRCIISEIRSDGSRYYKGSRSLRWTWHGKLKYIDYSEKPKPTPVSQNPNVYYRVKTKKYGWLPEVKNLNDYAGWKNDPIIDLAIKVDKGSIKYRVAPKKKDFLPFVTGYNINDAKNGYAGIDKPIDRVQVYYYTPDDIVKASGYKKAKYRVNDGDWQYDNETTKGQQGYAGKKGKDAVKFEITIV